MEEISKWYLNQNATKIFFLFFLGAPFYLWMYFIITEFDKKNGTNNSGRKLLTKFSTFYSIFYFFVLIIYMIYDISVNNGNGLIKIFPFHLFAILCGLILLLLGSESLTKYEKNKNLETFGTAGNFFLLWFYIVGVWILQPKLNKYIE
ncbi:hypothetical protein [Kaistella polysaccharea]|uniref:hypothetical protein n=1 Tax=Kaistella polysaccharea TaxID=2878534 RepID=UPI001CF5570B|nr:hypothetical protein [Kaistella polysaccharea]